MMLGHAEMIARIGAGAVLGGVIGYERDLHRRPVGLRTHLIVAMTAATFMVISSQFAYWQHFQDGEHIEVDASRIAASVVSGIGFLAGGAILRTGLTVQGLTTAAGLWLVTAIGMCAGGGMFVESVVVTGFGIVALTVLRRFEDKNLLRRRVSVTLDGGAERMESVLTAIKAVDAVANDIEYERHMGQKLMLTFDIQMPESIGIAKLIEEIEGVDGVERIHVRLHA